MIINDGFSTLFTFSATPGAHLAEKTVTPPGISAGGPTDTTTMRNTAWRTFNPKKLKSLTQASFSAAYDTAFFVQANAMIGINQLITIDFADGSQLKFWGWLDEFTPDEISEGEQPTAACVIQPSNQDSNGDEVAPLYLNSEGATNETNNP